MNFLTIFFNVAGAVLRGIAGPGQKVYLWNARRSLNGRCRCSSFNLFFSMKKLPLFLFFSLLFFAQCKVIKYTPDKLPAKQLIWGSGGGFADTETSHLLLENGQIFRQAGVDGNYEELVPLKKKEAAVFFEKLASLQLYKQDIDKPGNLYYFLQEITEAIDSRATWGAGDYLPPKSMVSLYRELHELVKDRKTIKAAKAKPKKEEKDTGKEKEKDDTKW
jgi:hypothetical protein